MRNGPSPQDLALVRELAAQVAELAHSEEYERRRRRWRDVNGLRRPDRAPVWCRPARVWPEIIPPDSLVCEAPLCRNVEYTLRQHLWKDTVGDDSLVEPWWDVPAAFDCDTEHVWGLPTAQLVATTSLGGWRYDPPLKTEDDFERVTIPTFTYNAARTQEALERAHDLLGDLLPVRLACDSPLGAGLGTSLDQLRGMEAMLLDLALRPALIHRLMAKLLEGTLRAMRAAEATGLLTPNNYGPMTCSDPINGEPPPGEVGLHNLWVSANSQEFQEVSPVMWEEFLLNYQMPIFQQYGLVQYGCCEDLTRKIAGVLSILNLRVFVCSAWTDLDRVIEACGDRYTIMWRQKASDVTFADDLAPIRRHLEDGMRRLQGCHYQVVLREIETLAGNPRRLHDWARVATEVAEEWA